ncbi:MAG: S8 family peptidase [Lachnospirales bacterium]
MKKITLLSMILIIFLSGCTNLKNIHTKLDKNNSIFYYKEIDKKHISVDLDTDIKYIDNEVLVTFNDNVNESQIKSILKTYNGKIVGCISDLNSYQIELTKAQSYENIQNIVTELNNTYEVNHASINYITELKNNWGIVDYAKKIIKNESENIEQKKHIDDTVNKKEIWKNDKEWRNMWDKQGQKNWGVKAIKAPSAWYAHLDHMQYVNIGVLEANSFAQNPDVSFIETPLYNDFYTDGEHAIMVSGIIGAKMGNNIGICGICPTSNLYGAVLNDAPTDLGDEYLTNTYKLEVCLYYLVYKNNCKVINFSTGVDSLAFAASRNAPGAVKQLNETNEEISYFLNNMLDKGKDFVIVCAAGNQNDFNKETSGYLYIKANEEDPNATFGYITYDPSNVDDPIYEPYVDKKTKTVPNSLLDCGNVDAKYDIISGITNERVKNRIIVVGANKYVNENDYRITDFSGGGTNFSYKGGRVDITAPGEKIYSTLSIDGKKNPYGDKTSKNLEISGTSFSAPFASGVAGMMYGVNPSLKGDEVKKIIVSNTDYDVKMINAKKCVDEAYSRISQYEQDNNTTETTSSEEKNALEITTNKKSYENFEYLGKWEYDTWLSDGFGLPDTPTLNINYIDGAKVQGKFNLADNTINIDTTIAKNKDGYPSFECDDFTAVLRNNYIYMCQESDNGNYIPSFIMSNENYSHFQPRTYNKGYARIVYNYSCDSFNVLETEDILFNCNNEPCLNLNEVIKAWTPENNEPYDMNYCTVKENHYIFERENFGLIGNLYLDFDTANNTVSSSSGFVNDKFEVFNNINFIKKDNQIYLPVNYIIRFLGCNYSLGDGTVYYDSYSKPLVINSIQLVDNKIVIPIYVGD